jgi:hypothetical protein
MGSVWLHRLSFKTVTVYTNAPARPGWLAQSAAERRESTSRPQDKAQSAAALLHQWRTGVAPMGNVLRPRRTMLSLKAGRAVNRRMSL